MNRYIKKDIENRQKRIDSVHFVGDINLRITERTKNPSGKQTGLISFFSFADKKAYNDGAIANTPEVFVKVPDLTQLPSYESFVQEVIGVILTDPQFIGAEIDDADEVDP